MPRVNAARIKDGGRKAASSCAYVCSRNTLAAINTLFIFLGLVLIGVAAYGKREEYLVSIPALGGVIACGVFLTLIAILGLIGAVRHNQVILFFYMVIMSLLFILQLAFSVAALAVTTEQQEQLLTKAWAVNGTDADSQKAALQKKFDCCGFKLEDRKKDPAVKRACIQLQLPCVKGEDISSCQPCYQKYSKVLDKVLSVAGGVGLFFSFTLLVAVYLTVRYRNQKDPRMNPDAFL